MGNEPRKRMWRARMWKVGRWIDAGMRRVGYWRRWAYRQRFLFCYRHEWLSVSVAEAITNGSQRLGLGSGSDRREWFCRSRREWFATIGFGFGFGPLQTILPKPSRMVHNDWVWVWVRTVANGYRRRFGSYLRQTRLLSATFWEWGLTVRLDGDWVWEWGLTLRLYWVLVSEK